MKTTYSFCCRWLLCFSLIATLFIQQDYLPALLRLEDQSADLWSYVECKDVKCVFSSTLITRWARDTEITFIAMKSQFFETWVDELSQIHFQTPLTFCASLPRKLTSWIPEHLGPSKSWNTWGAGREIKWCVSKNDAHGRVVQDD